MKTLEPEAAKLQPGSSLRIQLGIEPPLPTRAAKTTFQLTDTLPDLLFLPGFLRLMFYLGEIAEFQSANAEVEENVGAVLRQLFSVRVQVLPPAAAVDKSCLFSTREGEFSCHPVACSPYRCLHNAAITGITSHRSM